MKEELDSRGQQQAQQHTKYVELVVVPGCLTPPSFLYILYVVELVVVPGCLTPPSFLYILYVVELVVGGQAQQHTKYREMKEE
jgi:hypothetical protein